MTGRQQLPVPVRNIPCLEELLVLKRVSTSSHETPPDQSTHKYTVLAKEILVYLSSYVPKKKHACVSGVGRGKHERKAK